MFSERRERCNQRRGDRGRRAGLGLAGPCVVVGLTLALLAGVGPAAAETPNEVVLELVGDNTYIAAARAGDFDEAAFNQLVVEAREADVNLVIVAPLDLSPTTSAFARRVREASGVDVAVIFGPDGDFAVNVIEDLEDEGTRAVNVARGISDPTDRVDALIRELTTEPVRQRPAFFDRVMGWVITLLIVLVGAAVAERAVRQVKKARRRSRLQASKQTT